MDCTYIATTFAYYQHIFLSKMTKILTEIPHVFTHILRCSVTMNIDAQKTTEREKKCKIYGECK